MTRSEVAERNADEIRQGVLALLRRIAAETVYGDRATPSGVAPPALDDAMKGGE